MHERFCSFIFLNERMEDEVPLKLIELSDFLHSPSILSKRLYFKQQTKGEQFSSNQLNENSYGSDGLKFKETPTGVILLKQKPISYDNQINGEYSKQNELIVPKDLIIFADDVDRKKIGLFKKSTNQFSRLIKRNKKEFLLHLFFENRLDIY